MARSFRPGEALAAARAARDGIYGVLMSHGTLEIGFYAPRHEDTQTPHEQDEVYVVQSGQGRFRQNGDSVDCKPGDVLFVPAGAPHAFHDFSDDFGAWVIFYGPAGGEQP